MPQQTWSMVCSVEVWHGMALATWHMLAAGCCSCTQFPASSQALTSVTQPAHRELHRVGRTVYAPPQKPLPLRAPPLLLGTHLQHRVGAGALRDVSVHRALQTDTWMVKPCSWLRIKARERYHTDGQRATPDTHPKARTILW